MSNLVDSSAQPIARKYTRPRHIISWFGLFLGLVLGVLGGLYYAWGVNPVVETDIEPWQMNETDRAHYMVAIMLSYGQDSDLGRAVERLLTVEQDNDPIQAVADIACELSTAGYVENNSGVRAVRSMMTFYQLQGKSGCADNLIPAQAMEPTTVINVEVPTPTLVPPATKTPTPESPQRPTPTQVLIIVPTSPPQSDFVLVDVRTFCDAELSGTIEVYVQDINGDGRAGERIRARWDSGSDTFFTGLKPERGPGYADFQMEAGKGYIVEMPGRSDPINEPLVASNCPTNDGGRAITSYRVVFRQVN